MKLFTAFAGLTIAVHALRTKADGHSGTLTSFTASDLSTDGSGAVEYDCTLTTLWSATDHPVDYPPNAHYSFPVLVSHSDAYNIFALGETATSGVQRVAEMGPTDMLENELNAAGDAIRDIAIGTVMWNNDVGDIPDTHIIGREQDFAIEVDPGHPNLSTITMLAPSPDWFTGFSGFEPIADGKWYQSFAIDTFPFDAGTDDGPTFVTDNVVTSPQGTISAMTFETQAASGIFVNANSTTVLPVATWTCNIAEEKESECDDGPVTCFLLSFWDLVLSLFGL